MRNGNLIELVILQICLSLSFVSVVVLARKRSTVMMFLESQHFT